MARTAWRVVERREWDSFADHCAGSFLAMSPMITRRSWYGHVVAVIVTADGKRVAQSAIVLSRDGGAFLDAMMLDAAAGLGWADAFHCILSALPAGIYTHGSRWHQDEPREQAAATIQGLSSLTAEAYTTDVIDLSAFPDLAAYETVISKHHRRHLKASAKLGERVAIDARIGRPGIALAPKVTRLRAETYDAKSLAFSHLRSGAGLLAKIMMSGPTARTSVISVDGVPMGGYFGAVSGRSGFYVHGGNRRSNDGLAHRLMLHHIGEIVGRPGARFVMGFAAGHDVEGTEPDGHRRFRFGFGAKSWPGTILRFQWMPPA